MIDDHRSGPPPYGPAFGAPAGGQADDVRPGTTERRRRRRRAAVAGGVGAGVVVLGLAAAGLLGGSASYDDVDCAGLRDQAVAATNERPGARLLRVDRFELATDHRSDWADQDPDDDGLRLVLACRGIGRFQGGVEQAVVVQLYDTGRDEEHLLVVAQGRPRFDIDSELGTAP